MRFSSLCLIDQLVTLCFINGNIIALVFPPIKGCTITYIEKMSHAIDWYFLTVGFANPSEKTLPVLGHLPAGMLLSLRVFFLSWQVRQESMLSFNICHHTQPKNHIHFFSCPAVSLLQRYSENTVNCTAVLLFTANMLQHLNLEIHSALV